MKIDIEKVRKKYNTLNFIWDRADKWHYYTHLMIYNFINQIINKCNNINDLKILNAGSGGNSYGIHEKNMIHLDIAEQKIAHIPNAIISSIENMPLSDDSMDGILCVGSAINYCDPLICIKEFSRILKKGGKIILEFENSKTFELIGTKDFNRKATLIDTFYNGREQIWLFSEQFIKEILIEYKFKVIKVNRFHILSPLIYRVTKSVNFSAKFAKFDVFLKYVPIINHFSSNTILFIEKT